jgi:Spy/CpxP family protein refolding chaperone
MKTMKMLLFLLLFMGSSIYAQKGKMHDMHGKHHKMEKGMHMAMMLDLTPEQQEKVMQLKLEQQKEIIPLKNKVKALHDEIRILKASDQVNLKQINAKIDEMTALQNKIMKIKVSYFAKIKSLLTNEQKMKMNMMILKGKKKGKCCSMKF